jgi:hypothetical protein
VKPILDRLLSPPDPSDVPGRPAPIPEPPPADASPPLTGPLIFVDLEGDNTRELIAALRARAARPGDERPRHP